MLVAPVEVIDYLTCFIILKKKISFFALHNLIYLAKMDKTDGFLRLLYNTSALAVNVIRADILSSVLPSVHWNETK